MYMFSVHVHCTYTVQCTMNMSCTLYMYVYVHVRVQVHMVYMPVDPDVTVCGVLVAAQVVRNVVNVDYHVTRYRTIVQELQKEVGMTERQNVCMKMCRRGSIHICTCT